MAADRDGDSPRVKVLIDANALMMPAQFRVDLFGELTRLIGTHEPLVLEDVVTELRGLSLCRGKNGAAARCGLAMAEQCTIVTGTSTASQVDDRIIAYAYDHQCPVVTNDRRMRRLLLIEGIPVIGMRKQRTMEFIRG